MEKSLEGLTNGNIVKRQIWENESGNCQFEKMEDTRVDSGLSPFFFRTHLLTPGQDLSSGATFLRHASLRIMIPYGYESIPINTILVG
jgi:hypothetical protein